MSSDKNPIDIIGFTAITGVGFGYLCLKHAFLLAKRTPRDEFNKSMNNSADKVVKNAEEYAPKVTAVIKRIFFMN